MPIKKSAMKALRQSNKRTARNQAVKDTLAYLRRMQRKALEAGDLKKAEEMMRDIVKKVDKAVQNKVVKKNTGARIKSRLAKRINAAKKDGGKAVEKVKKALKK